MLLLPQVKEQQCRRFFNPVTTAATFSQYFSGSVRHFNEKFISNIQQ
jgi:hypothetical protein